MFAQRMANRHAAPTSIKNSISGAKTWVAEHGGNIDAFFSTQLALVVKGFTKRSTHVPSRAAPLGPYQIRLICDLLDSSPSASLGLKPAILIGYSCFLRSSNLLLPTIQAWGGPHTLLAHDICTSEEGLSVFIRSTKTRPGSVGLSFVIPRSAQPKYCPVSAWQTYKNSVNPLMLGPAFVHKNGLPITPRQVVTCMRLALSNQPDIPTSQVSMQCSTCC